MIFIIIIAIVHMIVGKPGTENCLNPQRGSTEPVLEQDNKTRQETFIEEQDEKNNTIQNSRTRAWPEASWTPRPGKSPAPRRCKDFT
jgi:hypothetical protein